MALAQKVVSTRSCATCAHFRPSVKAGQDRGLCALYSLVMSKAERCTYGYIPVKQVNRERTPARA